MITEHAAVFDRYDPQEAQRIQELFSAHKHDFSALQMTLVEADSIAAPQMAMPWEALLVLADPLSSPFILTTAVAFGIMFSSLTLAPMYLAEEPYSLSASIIGVTFLPFGAGSILGAALGGAVSDWSSRAYPECAQGRMAYTIAVCPFVVFAGVLFAYALQYEWHLSAILITEFVLGLTHAWLIASSLAYLGEVNPQAAAASGAVLMGLCFAFAAVCVSTAVPAAAQISMSGFFWILEGVYVLCFAWWTYTVWTEISKARAVRRESDSEKESEKDVELVTA